MASGALSMARENPRERMIIVSGCTHNYSRSPGILSLSHNVWLFNLIWLQDS